MLVCSLVPSRTNNAVSATLDRFETCAKLKPGDRSGAVFSDLMWLPNEHPVPPSTFASYVTRAKLVMTEYGSRRRDEEKCDGAMLALFVDHLETYGGGMAMFTPHDSRYPPEFFSWNKCNHKYRRINLGNCYNRYTCTECGASYEVDSSD